MSKHTAGPWFISGNMTLYIEARISGGLLQEVAAVGPTEADGGYGEQQKANARLIASAPELLEALTNLVGLAKLGAARLDKYHAALADAQAVIAKALGEDQ